MQWEARIRDVRNEELQTLRRVFTTEMYATFLSSKGAENTNFLPVSSFSFGCKILESVVVLRKKLTKNSVNPMLLSAVSLGAYAIINGTLSPSVAFTAIAIFGELEFVLSVVPELAT